MADFKSKMVLNVPLQYARLNSPYIFNSTTRKSEKCEATRSGANRSIGWTMQRDAATELWNEAKAHFNECKTRNSSLGDFKGIHSFRKNDDGTISFNAKRNCMTSKGQPSQAVKVVDGANKPLDDLAIWSGSEGGVKFAMWPSFNQSKNEWGISLMLEAVQVTKAVYGSDEDFPVDPNAAPDPGGFPTVTKQPSSDPFGLPDNKNDADLQKTLDAISAEFDDEIPF